MFEIRYEIFEDDICKLRVIDLQTFNKEYNQIYGCFTIKVNGIEYLPFPSPEMRLETKRIYSELILTHFEFLIDVYHQLKKTNYVALKYIENPWTWLEFSREDNNIIISELKIEILDVRPILTDRELFIKALRNNIINETILWDNFEKELFSKSNELIKKIQGLNISILKSKRFDQISLFAQEG